LEDSVPIYEYRCDSCGYQKEHLQKMSDPQLTTCPECGKDSYCKQLSAAGFQLKGSGWYATDFKGSGKSRSIAPARPGKDAVHHARPTDQTLFHHGTADLGPVGHHRLGTVDDYQHPDQSLRLLPMGMHPEHLVGFAIPGAGAVLTLAMILLTGLLAANFIGQKLVVWSEKVLARIPVVNSVYNSVKQVSDTLFSPNGNAFRKALLVQYPHQGCWTIAFQTGQPGGDIVNHLGGDHVSVYVPTTPNPTSGFFLMFPAKDVIELEMSVDEALKYIISMGVVAPHPHHRVITNT
jgi:putative FmdB family regulatory protein